MCVSCSLKATDPASGAALPSSVTLPYTQQMSNVRQSGWLRSFIGASAVFLAAALGLDSLHAEVFRYRDEAGREHFVDSAEKVPEQFRDAAQPSKGRVSKLPSRDYEKQERTSPSFAAGSTKVTMFVTSWCGYCKQAEEFLKSNGVNYERYDIERDSVGRKKYEALGGGGFPLIQIGSKVIRGFDKRAIAEALGTKKKRPKLDRT